GGAAAAGSVPRLIPHATPAARKPRGVVTPPSIPTACVTSTAPSGNGRPVDGRRRRAVPRDFVQRQHHGVLTAFWNSGQDRQSVVIFSGTERCGTIEKFCRTKNRASCGHAESVRHPGAFRRPER